MRKIPVVYLYNSNEHTLEINHDFYMLTIPLSTTLGRMENHYYASNRKIDSSFKDTIKIEIFPNKDTVFHKPGTDIYTLWMTKDDRKAARDLLIYHFMKTLGNDIIAAKNKLIVDEHNYHIIIDRDLPTLFRSKTNEQSL